jgi:hypothetical protein
VSRYGASARAPEYASVRSILNARSSQPHPRLILQPSSLLLMLRLPLGVLRTRAVATTARCYGARYTSHAPTTKSPLSRTVLKWTLTGTGLGIGLTATGFGVALYKESNLKATAEREGTRPPTPLRELLRTYVVYGLCSFPTLVDWSPTILSTLLGIPLVDKITEAVVRVTFFDQVCLFISSMFPRLNTEISV